MYYHTQLLLLFYYLLLLLFIILFLLLLLLFYYDVCLHSCVLRVPMCACVLSECMSLCACLCWVCVCWMCVLRCWAFVCGACVLSVCTFIHMCWVCVCWVSVCRYPQRPGKELEVVVNCLIWVLGTKLRSSASSVQLFPVTSLYSRQTNRQLYTGSVKKPHTENPMAELWEHLSFG